MKEFEREALLDRVNRDGATVGVDLPECVEISGDSVTVRDQVMELQHRESLTPTDEARCDSLTGRLRRAKRRRLDALRTESMAREKGEAIASDIIRIERALEALQGVGKPSDIEAAMKEQSVADAARWRHFVKRASKANDGRRFQR